MNSYVYCDEIKLWSNVERVLIEECEKKNIKMYTIVKHEDNFKKKSSKTYGKETFTQQKLF